MCFKLWIRDNISTKTNYATTVMYEAPPTLVATLFLSLNVYPLRALSQLDIIQATTLNDVLSVSC